MVGVVQMMNRSKNAFLIESRGNHFAYQTYGRAPVSLGNMVLADDLAACNAMQHVPCGNVFGVRVLGAAKNLHEAQRLIEQVDQVKVA